MRTFIGVAVGFSVVLQRYILLGILFAVLGLAMIGGATGFIGIHSDAVAETFVGRVFFFVLGSCFFCVGTGLHFGGFWWLRRATWLLNHTTPVVMLMNMHTRLVHEGEGPSPGDVMLTSFAKLIPVDAGAGIRQFKRVPLEWPTWRLRWHNRRCETVHVFYDFVLGGPLVIKTSDEHLFVSQMLWDRTRRHRHENPPRWLKTLQK